MGRAPVALGPGGGAVMGPPDDPRLCEVILQGCLSTSAEGQERLRFWAAATGGMAAPSPEIERALARDILALLGQVPAERLRARRGSMLDRAGATVRAAAVTDRAGLRHQAGPGDVTVTARQVPFAGFFAVESYALRFRRFDGTPSPPLQREVFVGCDAVTVLPYDPRSDRVLLIEQMRTGPLARGEANPWQLEAVAGRVDAGETPEVTARREALEEAGLHLKALEPVAEYYPTPGAVSEYLYSYIGLCDLPDDAAGIHGLAEEAEDIRGHLLSADQAFALLDRGGAGNAPLILSLQWLWRHRARLQRAAGGV